MRFKLTASSNWWSLVTGVITNHSYIVLCFIICFMRHKCCILSPIVSNNDSLKTRKKGMKRSRKWKRKTQKIKDFQYHAQSPLSDRNWQDHTCLCLVWFSITKWQIVNYFLVDRFEKSGNKDSIRMTIFKWSPIKMHI